ncbi:MAG: DMT family protein [Bacteroidetes bacterium]|nr:DMT family protein [Bacteroidota bacterium]
MFPKALKTILFLLISNSFMTLAWYGHLKFKEYSWGKSLGLISVILISWGLAFFEYMFQVPANRIGYKEDGGPFSLVELKTIQEAITLIVFMIFTLVFFKNERLAWNHIVGFLLIIAAVFVVFKKW